MSFARPALRSRWAFVLAAVVLAACGGAPTPCCPSRASCDREVANPSSASATFQAGFVPLGSATGAEDVGDGQLQLAEDRIGASGLLIGALEWHQGTSYAWGPEWGLALVPDPFVAGEPVRPVLLPGVRVRLIFPVTPEISATVLGAMAAAVWPSKGALGWSLRSTVGVEYQLTPTLALTADLGYLALAGWGSDPDTGLPTTTITEAQMLRHAGVPILFGIRSASPR